MLYLASGNVEKVKEMLALKPSMAALEDKDGATPLMYASNKGHKAVRGWGRGRGLCVDHGYFSRFVRHCWRLRQR